MLRLPALITASLLGLCLVLTGCGTVGGTASAGGSDASAVAASTGDTVDLGFTAETVAGQSFQGSSLEGRPTVLWFWAPWCPTCKSQVPGVDALQKMYGDKVNVVGVGSLDDPAPIADFAATVSPDVTMLADPDGAVWRHFGVTAQSTYLVLDADGTAVASGSLSDADLSGTVRDLVG